MKDRLQSDIFKTLMGAIFASLSYFFANSFQISKLFLNLSDSKWHVTISVFIYTALLNSLLLWFLSLRTSVQVEIIERKDKSDKIRLDDKPRATEVKVIVDGNLKKIEETVEVTFPEWVDVMVRNTPDLNQQSSQTYHVNLADIVSSGKSETRVFYFDITMKSLYMESGRTGEVVAKINGCSLRYHKSVKVLTVHYSL